MAEFEELDLIDRKILAILQINGRISAVELARKTKLSSPSVGARLRRLEEKKFILGYSARLNPQLLLRPGLLVFVQIWLRVMTPAGFKKFKGAVKKHPEILECHMVTGGYDYLIKVRVADMPAYTDFFNRVLLKLPNLRETHSYTVMEEVIPDAPIPVPGLS